MLRRRLMMMLGQEEDEVKEVGTVVTNPNDGDYGTITFSLPYSEGIHYYLLEQTDVIVSDSNRAVPAMILRIDYVDKVYMIGVVNRTKKSMSVYCTPSTYFTKNEDGTFTYIGSSGFRFNLPITYHIYHLAEGKV